MMPAPLAFCVLTRRCASTPRPGPPPSRRPVRAQSDPTSGATAAAPRCSGQRRPTVSQPSRLTTRPCGNPGGAGRDGRHWRDRPPSLARISLAAGRSAAVQSVRKRSTGARIASARVLTSGAAKGSCRGRWLSAWRRRMRSIGLGGWWRLEAGRWLAGGDAKNLRWIVGRAEDAPLNPPYDLTTAGESLHWMAAAPARVHARAGGDAGHRRVGHAPPAWAYGTHRPIGAYRPYLSRNSPAASCLCRGVESHTVTCRRSSWTCVET